MFYSQFILAKKGPLGTIWIAAHLERKLRKNQVADTDIGVSVDSILSPDVPIALRLSSHLLLGVVRIYSRKVNYLFHDCSEALLKVKQAFRSTAVDLPPEESTAPYHSITLPETFDLDDFELPDGDDFQGNFVDQHVSTREQITLQDSVDTVVYSTSQFGLDERFGDGDTSQGFDLDEELFLDKLTSSDHTVLLFDSDNLDPQASRQPMSPFTGMDIDDDTDLMKVDDEMDKVLPTGSKVEIDLNTQDVKIFDDPAPLCGSPIQSLNFDGHDLPEELIETSVMDPTPEKTHAPPDTAGFMEEMSPFNNYTNEGFGHGLVNKTSQSNSQEGTMHEGTNNLHLDIEHCDPKLAAQDILENPPSKVQFEVINEGDCSLRNNEISELDISKIPQDTPVKRQGGSAVLDVNSISLDTSHPISLSTAVLTEQMKPTSPASTVLGDASALPVIMERTGTPQNGDTSNASLTFSHVNVVSTEGVPVPGTMDVAAASTSMETCDKPSVGFYANSIPTSDGLTVSIGTSGCIRHMDSDSEAPSKLDLPGDMPVSMPYVTSGCIEHKEQSASAAPAKVGPPVDLPVSMPHVGHSLLGSLGVVEFNNDKSRACSGPEVTEVRDVVTDKDSFGHGEVLRACKFLPGQCDTIFPAQKDSAVNAPEVSSMAAYNPFSRQPDTVIPVEGGFQLSVGDMSSVRAEPCSLAMLGQMPVRTSGFSNVVQGEHFQPTSMWNTEPVFYPSNGPGAHVANFNNVISRDGQSGNIHYPASSEIPVPDREWLRSAPAAISFPPNSLPRVFTSENEIMAKGVISKDSLSQHLNYPVSRESSFPEPERMLSAPTEIPLAPNNYLMHSTTGNQVFTISEASGSGFKTLSGKKRQLTENELGQHDSAAKRSGTQSKATVDFIPNDYDVLSSILAARSSALKLKPTPSQPDTTSKKRPRVTPRTSVAKRKVLLDDTMVLHGDTIRQQLTSTEDIRRIRKKAPCTRPEIWMIQKLLLEEEVFSETLFTGISSDLIGLHTQTYGGNIKVPQMDAGHLLPEAQDVVMLSNSGHHTAEANAESTENSCKINESMETSKQFENRLSEQYQINAVECNSQEQTRHVAEISPLDFQKSHLDTTAAPETESGSGAADMINAASSVGSEFPFGMCTIPEDRCNETVGSEIDLSANRTKEIETVLHNDGNFDIQYVAEKNGGFISERSKEIEDATIFASEVKNREGPPLTEGVLEEQNGSVNKSDGAVIDLQSDGNLDLQSVEKDPLTEGVAEEQNGSVNKSNGAEIVLQNDVNLDLQSVEKDIFIMDRSNEKEDGSIYTSDVGRESILLSDAVPMEKDGSVQEVFESSSVGVIPQTIAQDPQETVSSGSLLPTNITVDNYLTENKDDVLPDGVTIVENHKSTVPNNLIAIEGPSDTTVGTKDHGKVGTWSELENVGNENGDESVRNDAGNLTSNLMSVKDPQRDFSNALESAPNNEGKNQGSQDTDHGRSVVSENLSSQLTNPEATVIAETTVLDNDSVVDTSFDLENTFEEEDTGFLNFDDDEELEEEDNPVPSTEEARILDTSGWSSRTRGVAKYLQTQFDAETGFGRKVLCMDNLLLGKSRKEASRMFFETLVLKTRDYVHVEQEKPFDVINIKPRGKLVKSTF